MAMVSSYLSDEKSEIEECMKWTKIVGTKFEPSDEILADHYLAGKVSGRSDGIFKLIKEADIYEYEPSVLSSFAYDFGDGMMYFFTTLKMKYQKGTIVDRLTLDGNGFWKKTGNSSYVKSKEGKQIASKTPLAYYRNNQNSGKPVKTQWLMKEYMLLQNQNDEKSKTLALCVIYLHCKRRKQCESGKECCDDDKSKRSSMPFIGEGYSKIIATASCSSLPPSQNSNLIISSAENLRNAFCSNSLFNLTSNVLQDNPESLISVNIPTPNSDQNILNSLIGPQGSIDRNDNMIPNSETLFSDNISKSSNENFPQFYPVDNPESLVAVNNFPNTNSVMGSQSETDSNLELDSKTIAEIENWLLNEDSNNSPPCCLNCSYGSSTAARPICL